MRRGALVGPHGDLAWRCAPRRESDAVFSSLTGGGGTSTVPPGEERHVRGGSYEHGTLIRHSRWMTSGGAVERRRRRAPRGRHRPGHRPALRPPGRQRRPPRPRQRRTTGSGGPVLPPRTGRCAGCGREHGSERRGQAAALSRSRALCWQP
ncbi:trehalase-like domain-containing protein [Kitasatospora sp. NRRL B-11411]|uniref:trehalase-like domain-containing protein n=1 Tax=Kitasatospora sp. NRRL B-11411 TaxID=1463822 RepID=UPI00350F3023